MPNYNIKIKEMSQKNNKKNINIPKKKKNQGTLFSNTKNHCHCKSALIGKIHPTRQRKQLSKKKLSQKKICARSNLPISSQHADT